MSEPEETDDTFTHDIEHPIMSVYVAASSSEIERAEKWMAKLREADIDVVSTWPATIRKVGVANPMDTTREFRARLADQDVREVMLSNVLWLLLPEGLPSAGAYTELGVAIGLAMSSAHHPLIAARNHIICSGKEVSIFTAVANHRDTDKEAFEQIIALRQAMTDEVETVARQAIEGIEIEPGSELKVKLVRASETPGTVQAKMKLPPVMADQVAAIFAKK